MSALVTNPHCQSSEFDEPLVPIFVYGTLRMGYDNYQWASNAVKFAVPDCITNGRIYFLDRTRGYPVAKFDEEGQIVGDVLFFDPTHTEYKVVVRMEEGAGYLMREIVAVDEFGTTYDCFGFHYRYVPRGDFIASGDWSAEVGFW